MPDGHDMDVKGSDAPRAGQTVNRLVGRALSHWEDICGVRNFPSYADYLDKETPYGDEHIFVIFISDSELSDEIVAAGKRSKRVLAAARLAGKRLRSSRPRSKKACRFAARPPV